MFFTKLPNGVVTSCSRPITETVILNDKETFFQSEFFEMKEKDMQKVEDGTHDWDLTEKGLVTKKSNRKKMFDEFSQKKEKEVKEFQERKRELILKITKGTATESEQEEFANLL